MSRAFVKESEDEWLGDVPPDIPSLERFLAREAGEKVYHIRTNKDKSKRSIHEMSNGNSYSLDSDGRWAKIAP